jgi:hypothetical protein
LIEIHEGQFTIAREIAHAWLGHLPLDGNYLAEEQADSLVKSWDFQNPKYRYKVHAEHRRLMEKDASAIVQNKGD